MPGETKQDIIDSRKFLKTLYADGSGSLLQHLFEVNAYNGLTESLYKIPPIKAITKGLLSDRTSHSRIRSIYDILYEYWLNFVFNSNMRLGRYDVALESFENVINVKSTMLLLITTPLFALKRSVTLRSSPPFSDCKKIINNTDFWDIFIDDFSLPLKNPPALRCRSVEI